MGYISNPKFKMLAAKVRDCARLCLLHNTPQFLGFLSENDVAFIKNEMKFDEHEKHIFYGGHEASERVMLGFFPDFAEKDVSLFPIKQVSFRYRTGSDIRHRDFLGALMAAGITRESVGDILCGDGLAVIFLRESVSEHVVSQMDTVGREGVKLFHYTGELPLLREYKEISGTTASPRLDSLVKIMCGLSREKSVFIIKSGLVSVNGIEITSPSTWVDEGSVVTVTKHGKFKVEKIGPKTRKDRLFVKILKYI